MTKRIQKIIDERARRQVQEEGGQGAEYSYHGRLSDEKVLDILSNPEGIHISQGKEGRIIFYKAGNVVFLDRTGSAQSAKLK